MFCGHKLGPQNSISKIRNLPYAFTEQGVAMLATIIRTNIAVNVSIKIMDAFVEMRRFLLSNGQIFERLTTLEYKQLENEKNFDKVFNLLQNNEDIKQKLFFAGQIYDAYNLIIKLIESANSKIVMIDNYVDTSVLEMLTKKRKNVEVTILTSKRSNIKNIDVQKFNKQYPTLKLAKTDKFHDRFIIIDDTELYHCGASIKDLGNKCFAINKIENKELIDILKKAL